MWQKIAAIALASISMSAGMIAVAAPASAGPTPETSALTWINESQVLATTNRQTAASTGTTVGTVQVRYGNYQGRQHGWGRILNPRQGYSLVFEVDTNGDRVRDEAATKYLTGGTAHTWGAPTSSSSARAFRACVLAPSQPPSCSETINRTGWW
ncbi:hypothetical protein CLV63_112223 [Murinocardiopsis flavida]|uniref:Secreted protein n=1 Tax=Murinocardiopsis flavida TaxID=645275 RepID=A0A2P8DGK9_9ACTN|nr:hypothetical protein [Murinocardiopsis flavida]PSK96338.1 hypothetical protein CLV63_112223 [Murinocardiopsis flavida]